MPHVKSIANVWEVCTFWSFVLYYMYMTRRTKTICTIGPSSESPEILEQLVILGMDIARLNFSHASYEQFLRIQQIIEDLNKKHGCNVELLMDLQGPRIRVGVLPDEGVTLTEGQEVIFSTDPSNSKAIYVNDPYLHTDLKINHPIFLSNGDMELTVEKIDGHEITTRVVRPGILYSRKGVNVPETTLTTKTLTEKDYLDIAFGIKYGVQYIAQSFVRNAEDVNKLRDCLGRNPIKIVPKIERKLAMPNLEEIIEASDAVMVARGDLGIELPLEEIPLMQKEIIKIAMRYNKPSIVATQMLMSMVNHYRPTRAEVSDVANAVLDGAWAVMLSDETAFGKYPIEALGYLIKTIEKIEEFQLKS